MFSLYWSPSFNSNLVRLKVEREGKENMLRMFQFQSGTIKGDQAEATMWMDKKFQFQSGTIKGGKISTFSEVNLQFQFQSGTIKGLL